MEGSQARAVPGPALTEPWEQRWPGCPPVGHKLRTAYRERWVRFHSLPESKRHPGDESEYAVVLDRYHTVLDALFAAGDVHVITPAWSTEARTLPFRQEDGHWRSLLAEDDPDPDFRTHCHLFAARHRRRHGCLDEVSGVLITDTGMRRVLHPYDGGADVLLTTPGERDRMGDRYADWLSRLRSGLRHAGHPGPLAPLRPCPCHPRPCRAPCLPLGLGPGGRAGRRGAGDLGGCVVGELGAGAGRQAAHLVAYHAPAEVVAVDASPAQHALAVGLYGHLAPRLRCVYAGAVEHLRGRAGAYDVLYSVFGAVDFTEPRALLPAACAALRPGGRLVFSTLAHHVGGAPARPEVTATEIPARTPDGVVASMRRWVLTASVWANALERAGFAGVRADVLPAAGDREHAAGTLLVRAFRPAG